MRNTFKHAAARTRLEPAMNLSLAGVASVPSGGVGAANADTRPARTHVAAKMLNHLAPFVGSAMQNFTLVAPLLLVAALVLSVLAVRQTSTFISAFTRGVKSAEVKKMAPLVEKKTLAAADYQSAANVIAKNNPAVQVSLSRARTSIVLSVKDPALLPEFIYAMVTIQSYRSGVAWSAGHLCLNKCEGSNAATAEITGYTQAISFSGLRPS